MKNKEINTVWVTCPPHEQNIGVYADKRLALKEANVGDYISQYVQKGNSYDFTGIVYFKESENKIVCKGRVE